MSTIMYIMILIIKWINKIEIYPNLCLIHNYDLDELNKYWYRIKVLLTIRYHHYFLYYTNNNIKNKHSIFFIIFLFHSFLILFISTFLFLDSYSSWDLSSRESFPLVLLLMEKLFQRSEKACCVWSAFMKRTILLMAVWSLARFLYVFSPF